MNLSHYLKYASFALPFVLSCSGSSPLDGSSTPTTVPDGGVDSGTQDGAIESGPDPSGPQFVIHVQTSTESFAHTDGFSGQTARETSQGIRSFRLYRQPDDAAPVLVFDHGQGYVEAGYNAGDDTVVGSAPVASVPAGHYSMARFGVTHSRYRVYSTLHYQGGAYPGDLDCVQVLSDGTTIDGEARSRGWYRYVFEAEGNSYPQEGSDAPLPTSATTGGFTMVTIDGQTYYDFAVDLTVPDNLESDLHTGLLVNMSESFRWEDLALPDYQDGVYDTTPTSFEPVRRFGANAATFVILEQ